MAFGLDQASRRAGSVVATHGKIGFIQDLPFES